jgi:predicted histidine transporter YuiF (NhaC family)
MAHTQSKRAIQFIPLLMGLGITAGIGIGIGGIASLASYYNELSVDLTNDIKQVDRSIVAMQDQLDSLASVVSKIREVAEKGVSAFS